MGVVHYRYRSGVQTFSVPIPGAFASVAELKRLIAATGRHGAGRTRGRGPRDGIALCDPSTGEEYADEFTMIPHNSTVVVHRLAGHPTDAIVTSPIVLENDGMASNNPVTESTLKSSGFTETYDEEVAAIRSVIDAAEIKWGGSSSGRGQLGHRYGHQLEGEAPPPGYVCHICNIPGHFIQHCPSERRPPPPGYICHKCGVSGHFIHSCPNYGNRKYGSRRTNSLIPIVSGFDDGIPIELVQATSSSVTDSLPAELYCPLCKKVMTDAMLTSKCCYDSFCDKCIRDYIIAQSKCICGVEILADDVIPNQTLRSTISSMLLSRGGGISSGTGNLASSNSNNLGGKCISFTAPSVLEGGNKQHMDSAPSVATEGSLLITACKNEVGHHEKLTRSDLQSKTKGTDKASVKKTAVVAGAMETALEPRCQKQTPPDGIVIVSGDLERKVVKTKSSKKRRKAGRTGSGDTNCAEYDCNIPFDPSCYSSSFGLGGLPWGADPYSMYFMANMASSSYPMGMYNVNGISNLPLHAPGMQGFPASYYSSGFQPSVFQDHEASARARLSDSCKGLGPQSRKPERYHSRTSTQKGGSRSRGRPVPEMQESSIESHEYEESHSWKKVGAHPASSPRDDSQHRHALENSNFEFHDYNQELHGRRKARARSRSPRDGGQHRRAMDSSSQTSHDYGEEVHGRRKERARSGSQKSSSRHSYRRHAYEGSTSGDEESNFKRRW